MPPKDRFDLPVTCTSAAAVENYVAAVDLLLSAWPGAETLLERALAADPDFALAHIARGRMLQLQTRMPEARAAAARARALADRLTTRERQHIEAVALSIEGAAGDAWAIVREYVAEFPRDALPLSLGLGVFGLPGFSGAATTTRRSWRCSRNWRRIGATIGGFSVISAGPISRPGKWRRGLGWSNSRSPATCAMPMRRISVSMVFSRRATQTAAPALSNLG